jgi:hypothetical membrane protein
VVSLRSPGLWLFSGGVLILLSVHLAEFLYPGYSVSQNYISDLGVGPMPSRAIFTAAIIIFGFTCLVSSALVRRTYPTSYMWCLIAASGVGAVGVGTFNEDSIPAVHAIFAVTAFLSGNLAAIYSHKILRRPLSFVFVFLGIIGLVALALMGDGMYLGLGPGGMERMIFYPAMIWILGFGACLLGEEGRPVPG